MSMNSISDIDNYDSYNFHFSLYEQKRPLEFTSQYHAYPLQVNEKGTRQFIYDDDGNTICSPRSLLMLCINKVIFNDNIMHKLNEKVIASNLFQVLIKEAIFFGEFSLVAHLISIWPNNYLKLKDLISNEIVNYDSLSKPLFSCGPTILDYVLLGILITKPSSKLKVIDFTGFHKDLKISREICHLPLLWMKPENRTYQSIQARIKFRSHFEKSSLTKYLENFNEIYQEYDRLIQHEIQFGEKVLLLDCHINCEDVTLGLALQYYTPFKYTARKVWCSYGFIESEYSFKNYDFVSLINPNNITHLCLKDLFMIETPNDIKQLCNVLERLNNIIALSLIRVLNFYPATYTNEEVNEISGKLNRFIRRAFKLRKLDLSFNYLRTRIFSLLRGVVQPLEYLNLQDCRLDSTDIAYLNTNGMLKTLKNCRELNLSMNDFSQSHSIVINVILNCLKLNCLSISYCQIPIEILCQNLAVRIIDNNHLQLKILCLQPFTPPPIHEIIDIIHAFSSLKSLQKFSFLPSLYAFPGSNDYERENNALEIYHICTSVLDAKGRSDIEFLNIQN